VGSLIRSRPPTADHLKILDYGGIQVLEKGQACSVGRDTAEQDGAEVAVEDRLVHSLVLLFDVLHQLS